MTTSNDRTAAVAFSALAAAGVYAVWHLRHRKDAKIVATSPLSARVDAADGKTLLYEVAKLDHGEPTVSPICSRLWPECHNFVGPDETLLTCRQYDTHSGTTARIPIRLPKAGPTDEVCMTGDTARACIVTCGGVCPGLNTVVREIVMCLTHVYHVKHIYAAKNGYRGLYEKDLIRLTPAVVAPIHQEGGTFLGTSRGGFDADRIINALVEHNINQLYVIGGDGTHRGAQKLYEMITAQRLAIHVAAVPKTVDNDIPLIDKSFGFDSAVEEAVRIIHCAHTEALAAPRGVGLVKLMGRNAGFIAMQATISSRDTNVCLIPEADWCTEALYKYLDDRLTRRDHCVIVVAEGACPVGMKLESGEVDDSGNPKYRDIGTYLKDGIIAHMKSLGRGVNVKYIDPTYMIRSMRPNASDSVLCTTLAFYAVHSVFAGRTGFTVGRVDGHFVLIPIAVVANQAARRVDVAGSGYSMMCVTTGQPKLDVLTDVEDASAS